MRLCYKSNSASKSLILQAIFLCPFLPVSSQALDFAGGAGRRRPSINKVIHTICSMRAIGFQINDLGALCKARPKVGGVAA
jgi:hypothetical protein